MLYLQSGRLAPPKSSPHPPAKRPYTNSAAVWATCRRHVKDMGFLCDRIGHYRHGPRDLPCFSLMNVTKHGACQYALRSLSPPHGDSHKLRGNGRKHYTKSQAHKNSPKSKTQPVNQQIIHFHYSTRWFAPFIMMDHELLPYLFTQDLHIHTLSEWKPKRRRGRFGPTAFTSFLQSVPSKAVPWTKAHPRCWPVGCGLLSAQLVNAERLNRSTPGLIIKFPLNTTSCKTPWVGRLQIFKWWEMFAKFCRSPEPDPIMGTSTHFMTDFHQHSSRQGPEALLRLRLMTLPSLIWLL